MSVFTRATAAARETREGRSVFAAARGGGGEAAAEGDSAAARRGGGTGREDDRGKNDGCPAAMGSLQKCFYVQRRSSDERI